MRKRKFRKATLSISIGAIVVIVIAFVVLGLGLTLTKTIFGGAKEKIPEIFAITKLGQEPTAETPLTIPDAIDIKRNSDKELEVGFYNKETRITYNVSIGIKNCQPVSEGITQDQMAGKTPRMTSLTQDVGPSEGVGYKVVMTEGGLPAGRYVCIISAIGPYDPFGEVGNADTNPYDWETKQIFLRVTT